MPDSLIADVLYPVILSKDVTTYSHEKAQDSQNYYVSLCIFAAMKETRINADKHGFVGWWFLRLELRPKVAPPIGNLP